MKCDKLGYTATRNKVFLGDQKYSQYSTMSLLGLIWELAIIVRLGHA